MRVVLVLVLAAACSVERPVHRCDDWTDCGPDAICEPGPGACSVADDTCASRRRFSPFAPGELAEACVEIQPLAGSGDLCEPGPMDCALGRRCLGGRCVTTAALSANSNFFTAQCSLPGGVGYLAFWGATSLTEFPPNETQFNACVPPECPVECDTCRSDCPADCVTPEPSDPTVCAACVSDCMPYCLGTERSVSISAGDSHFCFTNGQAFCVGVNDSFQVGDPVQTPNVTAQWLNACTGEPRADCGKPYSVFGAGIAHTCAARAFTPLVECWGDNTFGQAGPASTDPPHIPRELLPFPTEENEPEVIAFLSASGEFTCAATGARVACWGNTPTDPEGVVAELSGGSITALDTGVHHACIIRNQTVWCWGANDLGQSSPGDADLVVPPTPILPDLSFVSVAAGKSHTCAVTTDGITYCWGDTQFGQLGAGATGPGPVVLAGPRAVGPIAAGDNVTCAVHIDDRIRCWGELFQSDGMPQAEPAVCRR